MTEETIEDLEEVAQESASKEVDKRAAATPETTKNNNAIIEQKVEQKDQTEQTPATLPEPSPRKLTPAEWFSSMHWKGNPFTFVILPELFVGYSGQADQLLLALEERHKFIYLAGPTGSGKTTMLKWITGKMPKEFDVLYIAKPPEKPEHFVEIFGLKYRKPWYAFWNPHIRNIYELPLFLNSRLKDKHLVVLFDEAHESQLEVLEWLRVLGDQVSNMSVVLSGLPVFETHLKDKLETFRKRIAAKIELVSLTKEEMQEFIGKRIRYAGGTGHEFSSEVIDFIYAQSGGFPREVLRICDELVNQAILSGRKEFTAEKVQQEVATQVSLNIVEDMTPMQKEIVELLAKNPMSPGEIANTLDLQKYKSRQHAVRSINNIMKKLYEDGYLERQRSDKAYIYSLSGKLRTIVVKR